VLWSQWQAHLDRARAGDPQYGSLDEIERRTVPVDVSFKGSRQALEAAGFQIHALDAGRASGALALADLERLDALTAVTAIVLRPTPRPALDRSVPLIGAKAVWEASPSLQGAGVIVAVIDTGIDIFHKSFQKPDGTTRILRLWDQDPPPPIPGAINGTSPITLSNGSTFTNGVEWTKAQIDQALEANRELKHKRFRHADTNGHGSHVAGTAAGNGLQHDGCDGPGKYRGVAPEADLVVVRAIALANSSNSNTETALRYVLDVAQQLRTPPQPRRPIVVNMSYGTHIGAHDGSASEERGIERELGVTAGTPLTGAVVVVAAGNEGSDAIHLAGTVPGSTQSTFSFFVRSADAKTDRFDLWYNGSSSLDIRIETPRANLSGWVSPGGASPPAVAGHTISVSSTAIPSTFNNKKNISFAITPPARGVMLRDEWKVHLRETAGTTATFDMWINTEKSDGFPTFGTPTDAEAVKIAHRKHSAGMPGTAPSAITVAAFRDDNGLLTDFSSWGPDAGAGAPPGERKPTIAAPGYGIYAPKSMVARTRPCSECCTDYYVDMNGTSMAAPHVAGVVALMLQKNRGLTFRDIRQNLQLAATLGGIPVADQPPIVDAPTGLRHNHIWGAGKLDAQGAVNETPLPPPPPPGGGGGGGPVPFVRVELPPPRPPSALDRLRGWQRDFAGRPAWELCAALFSTHVDEVRRLIDGNRRVATVWHRHGGPRLVRHVIEQPAGAPPGLPARVAGQDVASLLERVLAVLARHGSEALRADVARYRGLVLALPGREIAALDASVMRELIA
jgi:subtilisin family serine protease